MRRCDCARREPDLNPHLAHILAAPMRDAYAAYWLKMASKELR